MLHWHGRRRGLGMDNDEEDFEDDSVDSNMELVRGKVAQKDDGDESLSQDDLSTMPTADFDGPSEMPKKGRERTNSRVSASAPWGSNSFGSSDLGWEYDAKTADISYIAPTSTFAEGAESALVKNNT
ncbi:hypothetical protein ZWY2020_023043 [Hordeum vulgare]|nr:hypothetical protein ZWY2020_023043 [Hordeum vulgare]